MVCVDTARYHRSWRQSRPRTAVLRCHRLIADHHPHRPDRFICAPVVSLRNRSFGHHDGPADHRRVTRAMAGRPPGGPGLRRWQVLAGKLAAGWRAWIW